MSPVYDDWAFNIVWNAKTVWLFLFVAVYWSYCAFWGIKSARKSRNANDYFLAGRKLSLWVFVLAATATSFSGWTFIGHPGLLYDDGFQYGFASFYAITIPLTGVLFLRRQWLIGRHFGYVTPGEMYSAYFQSDKMRLLVIIVALAFSIPYLGVQLRAAGFLFHVLTDAGMGIEIGMWLLSVIVIFYVATGGLRAVAYVDSAQAVLLAFGIIIIGCVALYHLDGITGFVERLSLLAEYDQRRTPDDFSHYLALPNSIQFVQNGPSAEGGAWTGIMVMTYLIALMGILASPAFTMWAFAAENPRAFAPQQVWASAFGVGLILLTFTTIQGIGGHFLGGDLIFNALYPDKVNNVLGEGLGNIDLMEAQGKTEMLVPQLINSMGNAMPWLVGLLAVCALAAMQSTGAAYMTTTSGMLTKDFVARTVFPNATQKQQILAGRVIVIIIVAAALWIATTATDALVLLGGLAVAYGLQMVPALVGICYWPWFTRQGVMTGMIVGLAVVTCTETLDPNLTESTVGQWLRGYLPWGRWPWTIHSAGWGIVSNLFATIAVSAFTQTETARAHRRKMHDFLNEHAGLSDEKRRLVPLAWALVIVWFVVGAGPGAVLGNTIFGNPNDAATWIFGIPSIWAWQLIWWAAGVYMIWFLAYKMELSLPPRTIEEPAGAVRGEASAG